MNLSKKLIGIICILIWTTIGCSNRDGSDGRSSARKPITLKIVTNPALGKLLNDLTNDFATNPASNIEGSQIRVEYIEESGLEAAEKLSNGKLKVDGWLAESPSLINYANAHIRNLGAQQVGCKSLFGTPMVIAAHRNDVQRLPSEQNVLDWDLLFSPASPGAEETSETQIARVSVNHALPLSSAAGLGTLLQLAYLANEQSGEDLQLAMVQTQEARSKLSQFEAKVSSYGDDAAKILDRISQQQVEKAGYRAALVPNPGTAPLSPEYGIDRALPTKNAKPTSGEVVKYLVNLWPEIRRPVSVALIFDHSGSMEGDPLEFSREESKQFISRLSSKDQVALIKFATQAELVTDFTTDRSSILFKLDEIESSGGSAIYDGIKIAYQLFAQHPLKEYRKAIVLVTDGEDKNSSIQLSLLINMIRNSMTHQDVHLVVVALSGPGKNFAPLKDLVTASKGTFVEGAVTDLRVIFQKLSENI